MEPATKIAEVRRILDRYLVEVVETYELCPWARTASTGEVEIGVLWGTPSIDAWVESASSLLARPHAHVVMVVAPEAAIGRNTLGAVRDAVAARLPHAGIAEFHPDAPLDLASPPRLVPFLRRSPDPLLQLVPLSLLEAARGRPPVLDRARQAKILGGSMVQVQRSDIAAEIAAANHATVTTHHAAIEAVLAAIAEDRRAAYARVGISASR